MHLPEPLDLAATLHGGQAFRWKRDAGPGGAAWRGVIAGAAARIEDRRLRGPSAAAVRRYFRFERADEERRARLAKDPVVAPALAAHAGLRLLRQDPWETTVAFITSANNHVPRIEGILERIAARWGAPLEHDLRAFPDAATLARAREADLRKAGLGYRAPFVRDAARLVARGDVDLHALVGASADEARAALVELPGVGPKVADCIALFSLDVDDAFPVDRWVVRAMGDAFFGGEARAPADLVAFARARWGRDAGLAQQVLFHAARVRKQAPGTRRLDISTEPQLAGRGRRRRGT